MKQGNFSDDDAFLDSAAHQNVGIIRVQIWTINMAGTKPYADVAPAQESKIHERSKKGGTHQIKFAEDVVQLPRSAAVVEYLEESPRATFTFRYRSIDLLRADGIAPSNKRKGSAGPSGSGIKASMRTGD
ncbi:hypothetical protein K438DRAFT_1966294 [Mycena galopus ATCC 62051]|nr:hypothetical protein K438DRAFT_1966294 [Mycena galopus ATCC 62051]